MGYELQPLRGQIGLSTDLKPLIYETGLQAPDIPTLYIVIEIDAVSGGIGVGNPASIVCEHSWNGGLTWLTVPGMLSDPIIGAGTFTSHVTSSTGVVAPLVRVYVSCPAGEYLSVGSVKRTQFGPRETVALQPPNITIPGGIASEATLLGIDATVTSLDGKMDTLNAKDFATSAKQDAAKAVLDVLATEAKLEAVRVLVASLDGKDLATSAKQDAAQTTLGTLATEAKLEAVRVLVASLDSKDFATSAKQDAAKAVLDTIAAKDFATEAKLEAVRALVASLDGKDFATQTTLAAVKAKTDNLDVALSTRATEATLATRASEATLATRATEATAQKLREWPYADYDYTGIAWNAGTSTEVFTYKTGGAGGSTVGTLTVVYTDSTKEQTASVAYNPAKAV